MNNNLWKKRQLKAMPHTKLSMWSIRRPVYYPGDWIFEYLKIIIIISNWDIYEHVYKLHIVSKIQCTYPMKGFDLILLLNTGVLYIIL